MAKRKRRKGRRHDAFWELTVSRSTVEGPTREGVWAGLTPTGDVDYTITFGRRKGDAWELSVTLSKADAAAGIARRFRMRHVRQKGRRQDDE